MSTPAQAARWPSILLHPFVVFAVFGLLTTARLAPALLPRMAVGLACAIACVAAYVTWRWKRGDWQTVDASSKRDRPALYLVLLLVTGLLAWWLGGPASDAGRGVLLVSAMLVVAALANRWIKLSLHMASLAFTVPVLVSLWPVAALLVAACLPLLAWSRLALRRHSLLEVLGGTALGLGVGVIATLL